MQERPPTNTDVPAGPDGGTAAERIELGLALARAQLARDEAAEELERCRTELRLRGAEVERLSRLCLQLQAEVAALRASTSWRLTGPLRRVGRLLRR